MDDRLRRTRQLLGDSRMERLASAHVMVVGVGGVGSWAAEMLARAGVGRLTLVDFDRVGNADFNRQLPATADAIGELKVEVLARRFAAIRDDVAVTCVPQRLQQESIDAILAVPPDHLVDAIDLLTDKARLVHTCIRRGIPIVSSTGAGARLDPSRVEVVDLACTRVDPVARELRHILRRNYGHDLSHPIGVPAVMSDEPRFAPPRPPGPGDSGPAGLPRKQPVEGTLGCVTAVFGMVAASVVIRALIEQADNQHVSNPPPPHQIRVTS